MEKNEATGLQKFTLGLAIFSFVINLLNFIMVCINEPTYLGGDYKASLDVAGMSIAFYLYPGIILVFTFMLISLIQEGLRPKKIMIPIILLFLAHFSFFAIIYIFH